MIKIDRSALTLILAAIFVFALGSIRRNDFAGISSTYLWNLKVHWSACADVVVAGDSRVYCGVSPSAMSKFLPAVRIKNFGFGAVPYTREYLSAIHNVLDPQSRSKIILLGITPHSFSAHALRKNGFDYYRKNLIRRFSTDQYFGDLLNFVMPLSFDELSQIILRKDTGPQFRLKCHPDGWVATIKIPEDPREALAGLDKRYDDQQVIPNLVQNLVTTVANWRRQGIAVYAFRPPTTPEVFDRENRLMGFNHDAFVREFQAAGGTWIDTDLKNYRSFDGSHLRVESAVRLSENLARFINISRTSPPIVSVSAP